ncbi:hypothetical protein L3V83_09985 [Thiotrichales bacterium 19X7-9]|nr:hypothetical protein [Thiotrichales bacterium 19X7-9]
MKASNISLGVTIGATLDKSFKASSFFANKTMNNLAQKSKSLKDKQSSILKYKDIGASLSTQKTKLTQAKTALAQLESQIVATTKPTKTMTNQFNKAQKKVEQLEGSVNKEKQALTNMGSALTKAGIKTHNLNITESRLAREITRVDKTMKRKAATMRIVSTGLKRIKYAALGTVGAMTALGAVGSKMVTSIGEHGDKVAKTADKLGLTTDKLQALRYAAERSGVSTQTLDMSLQRMTRWISEAANGTGEAKQTLEQLGLSAEELNNLKPDQALGLIADKLHSVKNASDRTRIAQKLFDSEGVALVNMLKDGSGALSDYEKQARKVGYVLDEKTLRSAEKNRDAFLDLSTTFKAVSYQVGAKLMPAFTEGFKQITTWMVKNKDVISQWLTKVIKLSITAMPKFIKAANSLGSALTTVATIANKVVNFLGGWAPVLTVVTTLVGIKFIGALTGATKAISIVSFAVKGLTTLFLTNPIGLAIAAIGTAVFLIYKYWQPITGFFANLWNGVKSVFTGFVDFCKNLWGAYTDQVSKNLNVVKSIFSNAWGVIKDSVKSVFDWIGTKINWFSDKISWMGDKIRGVLEYFGLAKAESKKTESYIKSNYHDNKAQFKTPQDEKLAVLAMQRSKQSPMKQAIAYREVANQSINNNNSKTSTNKTVNVTNQITISGNGSSQAQIAKAAHQGTQRALAFYDTEGGY